MPRNIYFGGWGVGIAQKMHTVAKILKKLNQFMGGMRNQHIICLFWVPLQVIFYLILYLHFGSEASITTQDPTGLSPLQTQARDGFLPNELESGYGDQLCHLFIEHRPGHNMKMSCKYLDLFGIESCNSYRLSCGNSQ